MAAEMVNQKVNGSSMHGGSFSARVQQHISKLNNSVHRKHVSAGYNYLIRLPFYFVVPPVLVLISCAKIRMPYWEDWSEFDLINFALFPGLLFMVAYLIVDYLTPRSTYLVDFACFRPPEELMISREEFIKLAKESGNFDPPAIKFQHQILHDSGIGDGFYMTRSVFVPAQEITLKDGRHEAALVLFGVVNDLFAATKIQPEDIDILVVNCGVLNTTPSLSAMLVNHYKLRQDIRSFNLGGMGCAAGAIAVDLAKDLLGAHPGSCALVESTEIVTSIWYAGSDLDKLSTNCSFRMGAAAMLLSNRRLDGWRSKYELKQIVRSHNGMDDRSFKWVYLEEDIEGNQGLSLSHDWSEVAGQALEANIAQLLHKKKSDTRTPDYKRSFRHVCILASGKKNLAELQRKLELTEEHMEASRKTLEKFGNTSSSSVWYELAYLEAKGRVKRGDRVWQLAFGSGFKCSSMVWKALRTVGRPERSPWICMDEGVTAA